MNTAHRKPLPGTRLDYFDAREAVEAIRPGAWAELPYTSRVHAENDPGLGFRVMTGFPPRRFLRLDPVPPAAG